MKQLGLFIRYAIPLIVLSVTFTPFVKSQQTELNEIQKLEYLAAHGNMDAKVALGIKKLKGDGVAKNIFRAGMHLTEPAKKGHVHAQYALGFLFQQEGALNKKQSAYWMQKAAQQGMAEAQYELAKMYLQGFGVEQSENRGFHWLEQSAKQQFPMAFLSLSQLYRDGIGVKKNEEMAFKLAKKAADYQIADAQYEIADFYFNGIGVHKDTREAIKWLNIAAKNGHEQARAILNSYSYLD